MLAEIRRLQAENATLRGQLEESSYPGHYISTVCQRGKHHLCRRVCKYNDTEECQCSCEHPPLMKIPLTYSDLQAMTVGLHVLVDELKAELYVTMLRARSAEKIAGIGLPRRVE